MKTCVEFGYIGGNLFDNFVCHSIKQGAELAYKLAYVAGMNRESNTVKGWTVKKNMPRLGWENGIMFVSVSILDGEPRGPYSWKHRKTA